MKIGWEVSAIPGPAGRLAPPSLRAGLHFALLPCAGVRLWGWGAGSFASRLARVSMDGEIKRHYALLLGISKPWELKDVVLKLAEKQVEIELQWGSPARCPECQQECPIHDSAPERTWRHLGLMQFTTPLRAQAPRANCPEHGFKTMPVPCAAQQGRFTLLFERFAVEVLLASASIHQGCQLLGIGWDAGQEIRRRAVELGLAARPVEGLRCLGTDGKSFKRGQSYITLLTEPESVAGGGRSCTPTSICTSRQPVLHG